jgi:hypothetical protein
MDSMTLVTAAAAGLGAILGSALLNRRGANLSTRITPLLLAGGPMTLPQLQDALGMKGLAARGKVAMALNQLAAEGSVEIIDAPAGTPQMQKVHVIRYKLKAA